jgi:uncharacterized protein (DUF488 family)
MNSPIYTIGHSTHAIELFIEHLKRHHVTALCDVRSQPYSRMNPHFNREELKNPLKGAGIKYVFLGKELGARSEDKSCYRNGQVQYELLAKTPLFKRGIERVKEGAHAYTIALMCAEKEPLDCHRTILVARKLAEDGLAVMHILGSGDLEDHAHAIERLIARLGVPGADMFRDHAAAVDEAYARQGKEIAYREETVDSSSREGPQHNHARRAAK